MMPRALCKYIIASICIPTVCCTYIDCILWNATIFSHGMQNGETAVIMAAQKGHKDLVQRLVSHYKCPAQEKDKVSSFLGVLGLHITYYSI